MFYGCTEKREVPEKTINRKTSEKTKVYYYEKYSKVQIATSTF